MAKRIKLDSRAFEKDLKDVERFVTKVLPKNAHKEYESNTPKQSGNARRKTALRKNRNGFEIQANYDYARVLDEGLYPNPPKQGTGKTIAGYSTQAPRGMSDPTIDYIEQSLEDYLRNK